MTEQGVLGGRYELGPVLGRGGMAEVRRARDIRLGRDVAVKRLRIDLAGDDTFQARFRREAQAAAGLNHPNIVSVYDTGEQEDPSGVSVPYIVMELVVGHTLRDVLREGRKIRPERALELTIGVLDALQYSHQAGIIHRDIKPANVMLTSGGQVKVMDFGIARAVADTSASMTQTAAVIGTAQYLSPEQARGEKTVDNRSDIYAAGCMLYELLVGQPPFQGDSPVSVAYQHVRETPVPPSQLDSEITREMDTITLTALAKDPADRYQSAREMRDDITRLLAGQEPTAQMPITVAEGDTPVQPLTAVAAPITPQTAVVPDVYPDAAIMPATDEVAEEPQRRSSTPLVLGLLAVLLALGIGLGWWFFRGTPAQPVVSPTPSVSAVVMVPVPHVVSMRQQTAVETLEQGQLKAVVTTVEGPDDQTVGTVLRQDPASRTSVPAGSPVTVTVNVGPAKLAMPGNLVGQNKDQVKLALEQLGFTDVKLAQSPTEPIDVAPNVVISTSPAAGAEITKATPVTIYYSTGTSAVPDVSGFGRDAAVQQLKNSGFKQVSVELRDSTTAAAGTVIETNPKAGTVSERSKAVVVYVARTPTPTPTPTPTTAPPTTPAATPSASASASATRS